MVLKRKYLSYTKAKKALVELGVNSKDEYYNRYKEIDGLPSGPQTVYAGEWNGWGDYLPAKRKRKDKGVASLKHIPKVSYEEARKIVQSMKIKNFVDFRIHSRVLRAMGVSNTPWLDYKGQWLGFPTFLSKTSMPTLGAVERMLVTYNVQTKSDYKKLRDSGVYLPCDPVKFYKKSWKELIKS